MIDGLKPYDTYTDSRLPWLSAIPAHWEVRRNGRLFVQRNETGFPDLPILEVSLKTGVRVRDMENLARKQVMSDKEKYKRAKQGDISYNMMRMWQGAVGVAPVDGLVSPAYVVARPLAETNSQYYQHLFRTGAYKNEVNKFSRGIVSDRNRLYWEDFKQMPSPFPPPEEQAGIVRFLDHADRRIRRYIRAKRQLIALLNEQKQAIIHRAVTRGLDPHVKLKPSGIETPASIPEPWKFTPLKRICFYQEGPGLRNWQFTNSGVRVICVSNITDQGIDFSSYQRWISKDEYEQRYRHFTVSNGDLLLASSGNSWGKIAEFKSEERVILNTSTIRLNAEHDNALTNQYLRLILQSDYVREQLALLLTGSCQPNFGPSHLNRLLVCYPATREEQDSIVKWQIESAAPLNKTLDAASSEIELLREFRTRLIADVVTGKLDIREATAALPDELEAVVSDAEELLDEDDTTDDVELDTEPEEVEA